MAAKDMSEEAKGHLHLGAPPPYELQSSGALLTSSSAITADGTVNVEFSSASPEELDKVLPPLPSPQPDVGLVEDVRCPALNVVIQVVGSRGDVQPFIALGTALTRSGHRVRLATHNVFADFVKQSGLEFYPIGGDPEDLMAYMVKNPGLIPCMESLKGGDIPRKRKMILEMLRGCWQSCIQPDPISGRPFVADAIIANPPSFAHVHCAQALGIPVHMMFTMPCYGVVDLMTWQGLGDVINEWRKKELFLEPLAATVGPDIVGMLKVPYTYCWSPALVPKPADWDSSIDICGFFMRAEPKYTPPQDLADFLAAGSPPVYVGFGSIVLQDSNRITETVKAACKAAGVRVIISRGWSKLGGDSPNTNDVFYLGDCPHEWLFKHVTAVVHHGGAGTTACGLFNARPTVIVPFFGDQPFWGSVVAARGAGPNPIPHETLGVENLTDAIRYCLSDGARHAAQKIAESMHQEDGVRTAVQSFHRHLGVPDLSCDVLPQYAAAWVYKKGSKQKPVKLSNAALKVLVARKQVDLAHIEPYRPRHYDTQVSRWDPVTAGASSLLGVVTDFTSALGGTFVDPYREYKRARFNGGNSAGAAAVAAGKGLGSMTTSLVKGTVVDFPLAVAEGLRNAPALYGSEPEDHGKVTDWKSGATVGAKNFGTGFYRGITGIVTKPMEGARENGTVGLLKGLGQGSLDLVTKPGSAMFGIFAYPAQGIYKSIKAMDQNAFKRAVKSEKRAMLETDQTQEDAVLVVTKFRELVSHI